MLIHIPLDVQLAEDFSERQISPFPDFPLPGTEVSQFEKVTIRYFGQQKCFVIEKQAAVFEFNCFPIAPPVQFSIACFQRPERRPANALSYIPKVGMIEKRAAGKACSANDSYRLAALKSHKTRKYEIAMTAKQKRQTLPSLASLLAPPMFWLSLIFLVCQAALVVLWVDVPNLSQNLAADQIADEHALAPEVVTRDRASLGMTEWVVTRLMLLIWPAFIAETVLNWLVRPWNSRTLPYHLYSLLICFCPSLRMCARNREMDGRIWLPGLGWRKADTRLRRRLERRFSVPMIWIAALILPVLLIELLLKNQVANYQWLRFLLHLSTGVIWFCFAAEFILMVSLAEKKFTYCKKHWVDLVIILLPLFSFLRTLRILRTTKAMRLIRLSQLNQIARMYRLRGTTLRVLRALVLLDMIERIIQPSPEKAIGKLQAKLSELEEEAKKIRRKITKLEREVAAKKVDSTATANPPDKAIESPQVCEANRE